MFSGILDGQHRGLHEPPASVSALCWAHQELPISMSCLYQCTGVPPKAVEPFCTLWYLVVHVDLGLTVTASKCQPSEYRCPIPV